MTILYHLVEVQIATEEWKDCIPSITVETISQLSQKGSNLMIDYGSHMPRQETNSPATPTQRWQIKLCRRKLSLRNNTGAELDGGRAVDIRIRMRSHNMIFRRTGTDHPKASSPKGADRSSPVLQACVLWSPIAQWVIPAYCPLLEGKRTVWTLGRGTSVYSNFTDCPCGEIRRGKSVKISPS